MVRRRGCDQQSSVTINVKHGGRAKTLYMYASVLHMRGLECTSQPVIHPATGDVLLFNGEIFAGPLLADNGEDDAQTTSDTGTLLDALSKCGCDRQIADCFASIRGPFAFVFFHARQQRLWFGRDGKTEMLRPRW